jgi:hypothetical protein
MLLETILGGVTGLVGNVISSIMTYKTQKLKNAHEQSMLRLETAAMRAEAEANIRITKAQIEGAVEIADSGAYMASMQMGNKAMFNEKWVDRLFDVEGKWRLLTFPLGCFAAFMFGLVDWLRGFMRPALTMYLTALTTAITWMAWDVMQKHGLGSMTPEQALSVFNQVIAIVIYLTVSCVTWWFGDRTMSKFLQKHLNIGKPSGGNGGGNIGSGSGPL